jgi:hypothetical protein
MTAAERISTSIKVEQLDLFRQAKGLSYSEVSELFDRYEVWSFIDDAYEGLHVQGAAATYEDIVQYLSHKEAQKC